MSWTMSAFRINLTASNPKRAELVTPPMDVLVDTGSELTWLPSEVLATIGITPRRKRNLRVAARKILSRDVGYAILQADPFETTDEVVFAQPGDMKLLGVRTQQGSES
jgi:predicted aspartyl protease